MDRYSKFVLMIIAIGILELNYHMFKGEIFSNAYSASGEVHKIAIFNERGNECADIGFYSNGLQIEQVHR